MKRTYTVTKDENLEWYAHKVGFHGFRSLKFQQKQKSHSAADCMALPLKEYLQLK